MTKIRSNVNVGPIHGGHKCPHCGKAFGTSHEYAHHRTTHI